MPKYSNIDDTIRSLVAEQISATMEPYRAIFDRLSAFMGSGAARRGPGRPPKAGAAPRRATRAGAGAGEAAKAFKVGEMVSYKQGRGTFEAEVISIDEDSGTVTVKRLSDGKEVARPANKISGAAGGGERKPVKAKAPVVRKASKRASAAAAAADATPGKIDFTEGQMVSYKQGRGTFEAKIVAIDYESGTLKLLRETDGKEVTRPANKVSAAA